MLGRAQNQGLDEPILRYQGYQLAFPPTCRLILV